MLQRAYEAAELYVELHKDELKTITPDVVDTVYFDFTDEPDEDVRNTIRWGLMNTLDKYVRPWSVDIRGEKFVYNQDDESLFKRFELAEGKNLKFDNLEDDEKRVIKMIMKWIQKQLNIYYRPCDLSYLEIIYLDELRYQVNLKFFNNEEEYFMLFKWSERKDAWVIYCISWLIEAKRLLAPNEME